MRTSVIGKARFIRPVTVEIENGCGWSHAECGEMPCLYGFGKNEREALDMLGRETLSMHADLRDGTPHAEELENLKNFLDANLRDTIHAQKPA